MSRRSTPEKVLIATANVAATATLVAAGADNILSPRQLVIANAGGSPASITVACSGTVATTILNLVVPSTDTADFAWVAGLECDKGNSITVSTDNTVNVTVYYVVYDESAGVTKVQSRANTFNNIVTTRAPSNVVGQDQS